MNNPASGDLAGVRSESGDTPVAGEITRQNPAGVFLRIKTSNRLTYNDLSVAVLKHGNSLEVLFWLL